MFAEKENMVKVLLDNKADMIDIKNDNGETPLILVAKVNGKFLV